MAKFNYVGALKELKNFPLLKEYTHKTEGL